MRKTQRKIISVSYLYMWERFPLIYINFNFDFLDLHNVVFENYFVNELTIDRSFLKQYKKNSQCVFYQTKRYSASPRIFISWLNKNINCFSLFVPCLQCRGESNSGTTSHTISEYTATHTIARLQKKDKNNLIT
jgi:hypothetical protein